MQVKNSVLTLAIACGLMAIPVLAQDTSTPATSPSSPNSSAASAQTGSSPTTGSAATDQQTPGASSSAQSSTSSGQSATSSQSGAASSDSSSVQSSVDSALQKDDQLAGQTVKAQVSKSQIVLTGNVLSQAQKDHAEQVALQTAGSSYTVKNKIKVSSAMGEQQPK